MAPPPAHIGFKVINTIIGLWTISELRNLYHRNTEINRQLIRATEIINRQTKSY